MTPEEMRKVIDQYFIDGDDSYECYVQTNDMYQGEKEELRCSISAYNITIERPEHICIYFYVHPIEELDKCPVISREAVYGGGEFFIWLEPDEVGDDTYALAKSKIAKWLAGEEPDNDDGQYIKLSEKTMNFLYALVAYYYGVMQKKLKKEQDQ
jgi:hypothetical protein